jgi:pyochelin synthetase
MRVADLIGELQRVGVRLWEDGGQLRFRAPKGIMTEQRQAMLREHKQAVLDWLRDSSATVEVTSDPASRHDPFPLTHVQAAYLLGRRDVFAYGGVACHAYGEVAFVALDPLRLQRAWRALIQRHDMLRAVMDANGFQRVLQVVPEYQIAVVDLRGSAADEVAAAMGSVRDELDHAIHQEDKWPLFDLRVTLTDKGALLHVSIDFLIADYVSIHLLLDELQRLHDQPELTLPSLPVTFRDYLVAERQLHAGPHHELDRTYWWQRIDQLPPAPELPVLERPAASASVRFRRLQMNLQPDAWKALRHQAGANGVTASCAILSAYAEVIGRWSSQSRFTLDITLLNRLPLHPQVGSLVGDFTSVSLLAVEADAGAPFRTRAETVQAQLWRDMDHRLCSGIEVIREIARRRGPGAALMPIVFTSAIGLNDGRGWESGFSGGDGELVHGISQTPQVWIDCQVMERRGELAVNWDVREGVFPQGVVQDMFDAFADLLRRLAVDDQAWKSAAPMRFPPAQLERRREINDTRRPLREGLLHEGLVAQSLRTPDQIAVIAGGRSMSYGELLGRATAVAEVLRAAHCAPRDIVAIVMDKGCEQVVAVLGVLLAGAAYLPIDTNQPTIRRNRLLADAGVGHVLTQSSLADDTSWPGNVVRTAVDTLTPKSSPPEVPPCGISPDDLAYVIYTSGSTGAPKGVMISHRSVVNTIDDINRRFNVGPQDRILGLANLGFDLSVYDIFGPLGVGGCIVLPDHDRGSDPSHWAALLDKHAVTLWNSVPAQLQMLSDCLAASPHNDRSTLRVAMLSGDWIPVSLPNQIRHLIPSVELVSLGGATEAAIWSIFFPIGKVPADWRSIPYGKPLTNQTFQVLDAALRPCPEWVTGELHIGGAGLARGYLADDAKTAERFIRHPDTGERLYRTGDLGRYLGDGTIEFLGRKDFQVKIRGHRIELAEIEAALLAHPGVAQAVVLVDGDRFERRLAAFVTPQDVGAFCRIGETGLPFGNTTTIESGVQPMDGALLSAALAAKARQMRKEIDAVGIVDLARRLDEAALQSMMWALRQQALFTGREDWHSLDEIQAAARVAPPHRRLVRRWLRALQDNGLIDGDQTTGRYRAACSVDADRLEAAWRRVDELQHEFDTPHLLQYFRTSARHLPELLRGEQNAVRLLFPDGRFDVQEAAYAGNALTRYLNRLMAAVIRQAASEPSSPRPLRVLEIGAGTGGASAELIVALADLDIDYTFTDLSQFLLDRARERFSDYPWVRYGRFDLNEDYRRQGFVANSFDVVVCANVLHYARNIDVTLARIKELLRPGGMLVALEMTRDHYQILTSLEFLLDTGAADFEDTRRMGDATLFGRAQLLELMRTAGAEDTICLPEEDDQLSQIGLHMFAARFKSNRARLELNEMRAYVAERLPEYMLPARLQIVDRLPLSPNGKVDRKTLQSWLLESAETPAAGVSSAPRGELEQQLAAVWADALGCERIGRDENFFDLGGDSLLAARLARRIPEEVPAAAGIFFDNLLRHILEGPTVASLALMLAQSGRAEDEADAAAPAEPASPLVVLGDSQGGPVRVLVHDGSGTIDAYRQLSAQLSGHGKLIGLAVTDSRAYLQLDPAVLVDRLAADYAQRLMTAGHTACHLIGYHSGGVLATEIARQLIERGGDVESLTVISSYPLPCEVDDELLVEYLFALGLGVDLASLGFPSEGAVGHALATVLARAPDRVPDRWLASLAGDAAFDEVIFSFQRLAERSHEQRLAAIGDAIAAKRGEANWPNVTVVYDVLRHSLKAFAVHKVSAYVGDVTLIRHTDETPIWRSLRDSMTQFWQERCLGELEIVDVPGNHFNCLQRSHIELAARLNAADQRIHVAAE